MGPGDANRVISPRLGTIGRGPGQKVPQRGMRSPARAVVTAHLRQVGTRRRRVGRRRATANRDLRDRKSRDQETGNINLCMLHALVHPMIQSCPRARGRGRDLLQYSSGTDVED